MVESFVGIRRASNKWMDPNILKENQQMELKMEEKRTIGGRVSFGKLKKEYKILEIMNVTVKLSMINRMDTNLSQ